MSPGQILLDTYTTQAEQWCWRTDWHLHGESAWTLFWKFALLNQMTSREVAQLVIRRGADKRATTCAKPNIDLREVRLFDTDVLAAMFRVVPPVIRRAFLLEILPGSALRSRDHLRWCMQCMAR
jgi:hypothetical protein